MSNDFGMDQEIVRRLVERIIKLEVDQETLKRRVDEPLVGNDIFGNDEDGSNNKVIMWNRNVIGVEKTPKQQWLDDIRRSLNRSSHPGIKYLTDFGSPVLRLLWAVVLLVILMLCSVFVYLSYCRWTSSTFSFSYTETPVPLGSIPFPAITICPERNIGATFPLETLLGNCTKWACTRDQFEMLSAAAFLCPLLMETMPLKSWSTYYNNTSPRFMQELVPACSEDIFSYRWSDKIVESDCRRAFQTLYIDDRVCYSYNMLPASYIFNDNVSPEPVMIDGTGLVVRPGWTLNTLNHPEPSDKAVPYHRDWAGEDFSLNIDLKRKNFSQTSCVDSFQTFQVAVHHPAEFPSRSTHRYLRLPVSHSLLIAVTPHIESSHVKECQGGSRMFRHYSPTKCRLECRVKCSINMCDCVPLYLPRLDNRTRWCGLKRRFCPESLVPDFLRGTISWESIAKYYRKEIRDDLKDVITDHLYRYPGQEGLTDTVLDGLRPDCSCHCPPACDTISYGLETQVVPLNRESNNKDWKNRSDIKVYFKEGMEVVTVTEKRVTNYVIDFLAHFGGLVALLTGVSVLTLVEMLYLLVSALLRRQDSGYVSRQTSCLRRKQEWDKTAQTDPIFITDGHLNIGF